MTNKNILIATIILAMGIVLGGLGIGYFYYLSKVDNNFVTVKGLAEKNVRADLGIWNIKFVVTDNDLTKAQNKVEMQKNIVIDFLQNKGFDKSEIVVKRAETNDVMANPYRNESQVAQRYILTQHIQVNSKNVDLIEKVANETNELIIKGIVFNNDYSPIAYVFTKLNEIKPEMLEEATKNATMAANEFAKSSGSKVGKIRRANQGVFMVQPMYKTNEATELNSIEKKVRVVSTVEYYLE